VVSENLRPSTHIVTTASSDHYQYQFIAVLQGQMRLYIERRVTGQPQPAVCNKQKDHSSFSPIPKFLGTHLKTQYLEHTLADCCYVDSNPSVGNAGVVFSDVHVEVETFVRAQGFAAVVRKSQPSKWSPLIESAVAPTKEPTVVQV
jgi:hypothetical protein